MSLRLTLYIAGDTPRSNQAVANLRRICTDLLIRQPEIDIVDVIHDPERAEEQRILTTPTLVRESPLPTRRVTGDLSDAFKVLMALGLQDRNFSREEAH